MADFINSLSLELLRHVPTVTRIGLGAGVVLAALYFGKRSRDAGLLACVCVAYALSPYMPQW